MIWPARTAWSAARFRLTDRPATGRVVASAPGERGRSMVSRADLGAFIAAETYFTYMDELGVRIGDIFGGTRVIEEAKDEAKS